jgi:hypothetical protein
MQDEREVVAIDNDDDDVDHQWYSRSHSIVDHYQ